MKATGTVYLVGAGPGDPGLLTQRGATLLRRADVVVYDALVNPQLLTLAPTTAERVYGGKRSKRHALLQGELNDLLIAKAREGKTVVRLKGGDPCTFGRGGEEAEQLVAAGIPFEIVPGVSSVVAAPNYAGIPLTHREYCSSFTVFTGHEDPDSEECSLDWEQLARTPGTKVVVMGLKQIRRIADKLMANGMAASTPVAMIRWGTTPLQESIAGTLATIASLAESSGFGAPAVTVIGEVVRLRERLNWFESRRLFGQRVVVTRAREQASVLSDLLAELGAEVIELPMIRIGPPKDRAALVEAMAGLNGYDWLIFTSANGVTEFFQYFFRAFQDLRDLGGARLAAVGPATAAKLQELHLQVDVVPAHHEAKAIAEALADHGSVENLRLLLLRAEVGTPDLPKLLEDLGAIVDDVGVYETLPETKDLEGMGADLVAHGAEWLTFTSGSTVRRFDDRYGLASLLARFPQMRVASIGPETSQALRSLGVEPAVEAATQTMQGLAAAIAATQPDQSIQRPKRWQQARPLRQDAPQE
jgi:uroporphyrinogen III methyltransferase / synthase